MQFSAGTMADDQADTFRFLCGRAAAVLVQLGGNPSQPATPGFIAELEGLRAVAASLAAADAKFAAAKDIITQLEVLSTSLTAGTTSAASSTAAGTERRATKQLKGLPSARASVLGDRELLPLVLQWVGPGHWLLVASTAPRFRAAYMAMVAAAAPNAFYCTTWRAVLHATRTFMLAADCGAVREEGFTKALGQWGTREVFYYVTGAEFGLRVCEGMLRGAARGCKLEAVKWVGCALRRAIPGPLRRLDAAAAALEAAGSSNRGVDSCAVLEWLAHNTEAEGAWPFWLAATLCARAAARGNLATVQWMCTRGKQLYGDFSPTDWWDKCEVLSSVGDGVWRVVFDTQGELGVRTRGLADQYVLLDDERQWKIMDAIECAAEHGHLHIVEYFCSDAAVKVSPHAAVYAADAGFLDVVLFVLRRAVFEDGTDVHEVLDELTQCGLLPVQLAQRVHAEGIGQWSRGFVEQLLRSVRDNSKPDAALQAWLQQLLHDARVP